MTRESDYVTLPGWFPTPEPQTLAAYLVWAERVYADLTADVQELTVTRRLIRERITETRQSLTDEDRREYEALAAQEQEERT